MSDDSPFPPNKSGKHPNSRANLRPSKPGEPSRNPAGNNGRTRSELVAAFLDAPDDTPVGKAMLKKLGLPENTPRIQAVLQREYLAALGKSDMARRGLREQYAGKPHVAVDLTNSDGSLKPNTAPTTAEARHELDQALAAIEARTTKDKEPEADEATATP
jgi:hypothetical protein